MRMKTMLRAGARWLWRILDVRLPVSALYGLRTR